MAVCRACRLLLMFRAARNRLRTERIGPLCGQRGETAMKQFILASIIAGALALPAAAADYKIMAPAAPGGGWDQTARSMQTALQDEKISTSVQVNNVPGAGGTI